MDFLNKIKLIQGGMGVYVSNWRMARAVAMERVGITAGTVSGTGLDWVYVRLLQLGDPGGHIYRALSAFDIQFQTDIGRKFFDRYYIQGGKPATVRYKNAPLQVVHLLDGSNTIPMPANPPQPVELFLDEEVIDILILSGFAEVWLAKEGHNGRVFINFLKKIELPLIYTMYGAMLANVDGIIVGAGNPEGLAAIRSRLVNQQSVNIDLSLLYREAGESFFVSFDPKQVANGKLSTYRIQKPAFLAIASLENLVRSLAESSSEPPDGFIIEHHTAGGHNAGPQGPLRLDALGQPIYSEDDEPDLEIIRNLQVPFWLAGGYGSHERLEFARSIGANGVQAGSVFALAEESGMLTVYRNAILNQIRNGKDESGLVLTTLVSPTGFPFKVVQLENTISSEEVYQQRLRVCDIGLLQQRGLSKPDVNGMRRIFQRCSAAPIESYITKRGLQHNTQDRRCLCNGLLSAVGLGQITGNHADPGEEPAIITLGNHIDGIRRLSRHGQTRYWVKDVIADIIGQD